MTQKDETKRERHGRRSGARKLIRLCVLGGACLMAACGGEYSGGAPASEGSSGGASETRFSNAESYFDAEVRPRLAFCRTCHVPGGLADVEDGRGFMLAADESADYENTQSAWRALGRGVESNPILLRASNTDETRHSGGSAWPVDSAAYNAVRQLFACWDNEQNCGNFSGDSQPVEDKPLLGNPGKHYFVTEICEGAPDSTPIDWDEDPRRMLTPDNGLIDSDEYAVHFNSPFEICRTDTLFETQARQNELRAAAGEPQIYSAKPPPATCGEWRAAIQRGHDNVTEWPGGQPLDGAHEDPVFGSVQAWNNLWRLWDVPERPENYDEHVFERYGHSPPPDHINNPYPLPGEEDDLTESFGGSGRLPLGWAQGRDAEGRYNATLDLTCLSCHAGQIGSGQVHGRDGLGNTASYGDNQYGSFVGLPNSNTELGVLDMDLLHAEARSSLPVVGELMDTLQVPALGYIPIVNTTRGTQAADTVVETVMLLRDFDSLDMVNPAAFPLHANTGDQRPPPWWWLSNKTRYLWFGGHSTDSTRGNMYFGSSNGLTGDQVKAKEGLYEDVHQWTLSVEAPDYPQGYCTGVDGERAPGDAPGCIDRIKAEQGAVLFHEKDLWADGANEDIPHPKGNGSCASCHGAYSPRYIHDTRFLPDPKLAGTVGYVVPIEIIDTDPAQAEGWARELREHISTFWWSYPDAVEGYLTPEEKNGLHEQVDDIAITGIEGSDFADSLRRKLSRMGALQPIGDVVAATVAPVLEQIPGLSPGESMGRVKGACGFEEDTIGYIAPPLHGVWASGPYFHNASVPDVWSVLDPEERPDMWRRQRTTTDVHFNQFETRLSAYDFERLGWKYDELACGDGGQGIPYYSCQPEDAMPQELQWVADTAFGGLLWPTWLVPPPIGEAGLEQRMIYNTQGYSKKNRGHEWTRALTDNERRALLEYLKTL